MEKAKNGEKPAPTKQDKQNKVNQKVHPDKKTSVKTNSVVNPELPIFDFVDGVIDAAKFQENKDKLSNYIGQHFGELQAVISTGQDFEFTQPVPDEDRLANDPHHIYQRELNAEIDNFVKRRAKYRSDSTKVFFILWAQTSISLQRKFKEDPNFVTWKTANDPVSLWNQITHLSLNGGVDHVDESVDYCEAMSRFSRVYQFANESVDDFYERFQAAVLALAHSNISVWDLIPQKAKLQVARETANNNQDDEELVGQLSDDGSLLDPELKDQAIEKHLASLFLTKLSARFNNLRRELREGVKRGRNEYPNNLARAYEMAAQHPDARVLPRQVPNKTDVVFTTTNGSGKVQKNQPSKQGNQPKAATEEEPKQNSNVKCYFCDKLGHVRKDCPKLKEAAKILRNEAKKKEATAAVTTTHHQDEWAFVTKANTLSSTSTMYKPFKQLEVDEDSDDNSEVEASGNVSLGIEDHDVLLDNEASISIFKDASLLTNIRNADTHASISGVGGTLVATKMGTFGSFGNVYYNPNSIANIWCFYDVQSIYDVEYDRVDNCFTVTNDQGASICFRPKGKLYVYNPVKEGRLPHDFVLVNTVDENLKKLNKKDRKAVEKAKELYITLGRPSIKDFIQLLKSGGLLNTPVTSRDVYNMVRVYGPDVGALKGKTVRRKPNPVNIEEIIRPSTGPITLSVDIMFVSGLPFLLAISRKLCLLSVIYLGDRSVSTLKSSLDGIISLYASNQFNVGTILCDGEGAIGALKAHYMGQGVVINPTGKDEHVPEIERAIRQVKERVRSFWCTLPYTLTSVMIVYLVQYSVTTINMFPKSGAENPNISPRELFLGRKVDAKTDCQLQYGTYVQVHEDDIVTNTMKARTVGAIALGPAGNLQGTYNFLSLTTWRVIKRRSWTALPLPNEVIKLIDDKAMPELLRRTRKKKGEAINDEPLFSMSGKDFNDETFDDEPEEIEITPAPTTFERNIINIAPPTVEQQPQQYPQEEDNIMWQHDGDDIPETIVSSSKQGNVSILPDTTADNNQQDNVPIPILFNEPIDDNTAIPDNFPDAPIEAQDVVAEDNSNNKFDSILVDEKDIIDDQKHHGPYSLRRTRSNWRNYDERMNTIATTFGFALANISVKKGIKDIGVNAIVSIMMELDQLENKSVFEPIHYSILSQTQKRDTLRTIMFLKQKRDGRLKSRLVADGRGQPREHGVTEMKVSSPTVATESVFITAAIEAFEGRHVVTVDIEGAYLHANIDGADGEEVIIELDPIMTTILGNIHPKYTQYITQQGKLYLRLKKALYGLIQSARLFYEHLSTTLINFGFKVNPYDICVFNMELYGKQCTVITHVDDLKISCNDRRGVDAVINELKRIYKKINISEGPIIDYLGMELDYTNSGFVKISMQAMVVETMDELSVTGTATTPATIQLFKVSNISDTNHALSKHDKEIFHSTVQKLLYMSKRARPDILTTVSFLTTRVKEPTSEDQSKLNRLLKYLNGTRDLALYLSGSEGMLINSYIDSSYAVHPDAKGHTGAIISVGEGAVFSKSSKQKLVAKSSTEAELIGLSDALSQVIWTRNFLSEQGYQQRPALVRQDNKSTIMLAEKGRSTSSRTRHVNTRYFFVKDRVMSNEIDIIYTATENMAADFFTKPLQGNLFFKFRDIIMNINTTSAAFTTVNPSQGCVGCSPETEVSYLPQGDSGTSKASVVGGRPDGFRAAESARSLRTGVNLAKTEFSPTEPKVSEGRQLKSKRRKQHQTVSFDDVRVTD